MPVPRTVPGGRPPRPDMISNYSCWTVVHARVRPGTRNREKWERLRLPLVRYHSAATMVLREECGWRRTGVKRREESPCSRFMPRQHGLPDNRPTQCYRRRKKDDSIGRSLAGPSTEDMMGRNLGESCCGIVVRRSI